MREGELITHLDALRTCVINVLIGIAFGVAVSFFFVPDILSLLIRPYLSYATSADIAHAPLISLTPADTFQMSIEMALLSGIGLSLPWTVYQIWRFAAPGLYERERKYLLASVLPTAALFIGGVVFSYLVMVPAMISFFYNYSTGLGFTPQWTASSYFRFASTVMFAFGAAFELPVVILSLTWLGVTSPELLSRYRRHAVVVIFVVAAVLTPPDVISQLMMGLPMVALYELSIIAARLVRSRTASRKEKWRYS